MRALRSSLVVPAFVLSLVLAGCVGDDAPPPTVEAQPEPAYEAVHVVDAEGRPIIQAARPANHSLFAPRGDDWNVFQATATGEPGSWLFLYVPLAAPSPEEHWSYEIRAEAVDPAGGFAVLLTTDMETVTGTGGADAQGLLPRPRAYVSDEGSVSFADSNSVGTYVGGDRGVLGYFYAATANVGWTATIRVERGEGAVGTSGATVLSGTGTTAVWQPTRTDNLQGLGYDVSYDLEAAIPGPGWSHFHFLGPGEGPARWTWGAAFPERTADNSELSAVHAPPHVMVRAEPGILHGTNGTFEATARGRGALGEPEMVFLHAPWGGEWFPEDFGEYIV